MNKKMVLESLRAAFLKLKDVVDNIPEDTMESTKITAEWTIKDVVGHLAAWNWEYAKEIDRILDNNPTWHDFYSSKEGTDEFNRKEVEKRKNLSTKSVIEDWQKSFKSLEDKLSTLSPQEWFYASKKGEWQNQPITVASIFKYSYRGKSHEAGHAEQIREMLSKFK